MYFLQLYHSAVAYNPPNRTRVQSNDTQHALRMARKRLPHVWTMSCSLHMILITYFLQQYHSAVAYYSDKPPNRTSVESNNTQHVIGWI